jgi:hypothetical protein
MTIEAFAVVSSFGSLGAAVGIAMVIVGRSFRPNFVHTRFVLWARLSGPIAILLCGGVPLWIYALVVSGSPGVDPLGPELLQFVARRSCIPFLVGIAGLVAAGIWGRRQPPPALPDIFT